MQKANDRLADFLFEVGTLRRINRIHRQLLLTDDLSDNIASHSYRVVVIGWILSKLEKVDPYKTVMMCLIHDLGEIHSGDHNYLHKRYVSIDEKAINSEQLEALPDDCRELGEIASEYEKRESKESIVAKDADLVDQILLLREYEWQGNKEASIWLRGKGDNEGNVQFNSLKTESAKQIASIIMQRNPSEWWNNIWTNKNR